MTKQEILSELQSIATKKAELETQLAAACKAEEATAIANGRANCHGYWREDNTCSYCGSIHPNQALFRLSTPGHSVSGADWKYGWPHKFYLDPLPGSDQKLGATKFYNDHLMDADQSVFEQISNLSERLLGIKWDKHEGQLRWFAVPNTQRYGTVTKSDSGELVLVKS